MPVLRAHSVDPSWYLPKAKENWVCRCNILILMEPDKTLLFRHFEKCKNKFTKLRECVGSKSVTLWQKLGHFLQTLSKCFVYWLRTESRQVWASNLIFLRGSKRALRPASHSSRYAGCWAPVTGQRDRDDAMLGYLQAHITGSST